MVVEEGGNSFSRLGRGTRPWCKHREESDLCSGQNRQGLDNISQVKAWRSLLIGLERCLGAYHCFLGLMVMQISIVFGVGAAVC